MALLNQDFGLPFGQIEVDFVVPDLTQDLPLCIDPFLLYRSQDPELRNLHQQVISVFNHGIELFKLGKTQDLARLVQFPEVDEIGFGYSEGAIRGRGLGQTMNGILVELLGSVGEIFDRGIRHIEELQLLSVRIGPDLVSDTVANLMKDFLVQYTQRQSELHGIPVSSGVPVNHFFDFDSFEWSDGYFDLPRNPNSGLPVLLVPRRVVRLLPWINYADYQRNEFREFLKPKAPPSQRRRLEPVGEPLDLSSRAGKATTYKPEVVRITRRNLELVDKYVERKERESAGAEPTLPPGRSETAAVREEGNRLLEELRQLPPGREAATDYQQHVLRILTFVFGPELTDGRLEEATVHGTERRDIIFTNESTKSFWMYVRQHHGSILQMFECKNTKGLNTADLNQTATYLGARLGTLGIVVTRTAPAKSVLLKAYSIHNDSAGESRKTILILSDDDLGSLVLARQRGEPPSRVVQKVYRDFKLSCQ